MTHPILTIAIPTFNRPKEVLARVIELLPQLTLEVELLILDNHSEEIVEDIIRKNCTLHDKRVTFIRNSVNIGGAGNVCRCFEVAKTKWMWMLGDDDRTDSDAVRNIIAEISKQGANPNLAGFSCSSGITDFEADFAIKDIKSLCAEISRPQGLANLLFISSQVYNIPKISKYIRFGYMAMSSYGPHLVMILRAIEEGATWNLAKFRSVHFVAPAIGSSWAPQQASLGFPLLLDSVKEVGLLSSALQQSFPALLSEIGLKRGLPVILHGTRDSLKTSEQYYFRTSPYMKGIAFYKSAFLAVAARILYSQPRFHQLLKKIVLGDLHTKEFTSTDTSRM